MSSGDYYGTTPFMVCKGKLSEGKICFVFPLPPFENLSKEKKLEYIKNLKIELTIMEGNIITSMQNVTGDAVSDYQLNLGLDEEGVEN